MITRQTKLQLIAFLVISVVGLTYTGLRYAGLGKYFFDNTYTVGAVFEDSGGIFEGAEVTYRGVPVGTVEDLELVDDGVQVEMRLGDDTLVPADTKALVANRSAVGEQYVDLLPQRDGEPYLDEGDVIPNSRTEIPISPTQLVTNLDDFVRSVDTTDLAIVLDELGTAFGNGAGGSLQEIIDSGNTLTEAAIDALPETTKLIEDSNTALKTQRDVAGQFRSFNADLALLTDTLRESDPDFRRLYDNGTAAARAVTDFLNDSRPDLDLLLGNLVTVAQIQKVRIPGLEQILVTYPNVVAGGFTVVPGDGTTHFGLVTNQDPPVCEHGYETTRQRPPSDIEERDPNFAAYCALPEGHPSTVRGARNAPYPQGALPFPENGNRGFREAVPPPPYEPEPYPGGDGDEVEPDVRAQSTSGIALGDYDPRTGRVVTADGERLSIGTTNGAQRVFGDDSWQWLLLGPLTQ